MPVEAVLINNPTIDFNALVSLTHEALGRNIAAIADASCRTMDDAEKFLACLAGLRDENDSITPDLLSHVSFSVLIIADEHDLLAILEVASGMAFVCAQTMVPNVDIVVVTGTLLQWKNAVVSGTNGMVSPIVRTCYSKILILFDRISLTSVWNEYDRTTAPDRNGFLLEDRRR